MTDERSVSLDAWDDLFNLCFGAVAFGAPVSFAFFYGIGRVFDPVFFVVWLTALPMFAVLGYLLMLVLKQFLNDLPGVTVDE